jgi:hypothetical protein
MRSLLMPKSSRGLPIFARHSNSNQVTIADDAGCSFLTCSEAGAEGQSLQGTVTRPRSVTQSVDTVLTSVPFGVRAGRRIATTGAPLPA